MKKNDCQKVRSGKKWLLLWLLLFLPFWGLAQSNSAALTWNTQVGCIEYGSEVEDPKDPREPGNGVVFESLPPGQACQKVCEGSTVVYSVQGNNIAQVTWSAAGGNITSSSNSSATVQWGAHGSGSLQITVTYADNTQQTSSLCVQKINRPNANFKLAMGQEPQVCVNTQVYFDNLSDDNGGSAIVHYEWAVQGPGINEIFSTAYEPSYTFTQPGTYTVFLTVTNSCNCKSQVYKMDIEVESAPPIDITCKSVVCEGSTEKYIANNVCGGDWNVVGGTIVSQNGNIIEVIWDQVDPADGFGYVMYKSECGCSAWTTVKIPVVLQHAEIQGDNGICTGEQSLYTLPQWPTTNFLWGITGPGNAELTYTANRNEVYVRASVPGTYTLSSSYYNTLLQCPGEASFTIVVEEPVTITGGLDEICAGTAQTFNSNPGVPVNWNITLNNSTVYTTTGISAAYSFPTPGTYIVSATKPGGCAGEPRVIKVTQTPAAPSGTITGEMNVCAGIPYTYTLSSVDTGMLPVWEVTNGVIQGGNTGQSVVVVFNAGAAPYVVKVRNKTNDQLGCTSANATQLTVNTIDLSSITVTPAQTGPFCPSSSVLFSVNYNNIDPDTVQWSFVHPVTGATLANFGSILPDPSNPDNVIIQFNEVSGGNTHADLVLTVVKCGTSHSVTTQVEILVTPTLTFVNPGPVCLGDTLTFQVNSSLANAGGTMIFTFSNGTATPPLAYQSSGIYTFPNIGYIINNSLNPSATITENVTATLTVGLCPNYKATASASFTVYPKTQITVTPGYNYTVCDPNNYQPITLYGNVSTGITNSVSFQWYLNTLTNPIAGATASNYTISSNTPYGTYFLVVQDANGCEAVSQAVSVNNNNCNPNPCPLPAGINPVATGDWGNTCNVATASVTGIGSPTSITWMPSPLMTLTGGQGTQNATFNVDVAGAHTATAVLNYNGCLTSTSTTIIKRYEPKLSIEVLCDTAQSTYDVVVHNGSTMFDVNPAAITYTYSEIGSATQYSGQGLQSATFSNLAPGTYTFTLQLSLPGEPTCSVTKTITLQPIPDVAFASPGTHFCKGETITLTIPNYNSANSYSWNFAGTSFTPSGPNAATTQITINNSINTTIQLSATSPYGCTYTFSQPITVNIANFDSNNFLSPSSYNICEGSIPTPITYNVQFGTVAPISYTWMNGSTPVAGAPTTASFTPTESGSYWAILTAPNNCKDEGLAATPVNVVIKQKPFVNISGKANLCSGGSTTLMGITADPSLAHQWEDGNGNVLQAWSTNTPISFDTGVLNAGTYTYRLRVGNPATGDCTNYKDFTVTVSNPPAVPSVTYSVDQCTPYLVTLTANGPGNGTYLWSNGMMGQSIQVSVGGAYQVTYIAPSGCSATADEMVPHSLESLMWIFPTGCFERCPRDEGYIIGPRGDYADWSWLHNGHIISNGSGFIDPLWQPNQPGTYQLSVSNGGCTVTSGTMNVAPDPENCETGDCKTDGYIKEVKGGNPYLIYGQVNNYGSTAVTFSIVSANGYGTYVPSSVTIPPGGSYDFNVNPLLFYPVAGFSGGGDDILFQSPFCEFKHPIEFSKPENRMAAPKNTAEAITLSPNPAREQVRITYNTGDEKTVAKMVMIHDISGNVKFRKVLDAPKGEITVPLNGWLQGVYIVSVITDGKALQSKLLKE